MNILVRVFTVIGALVLISASVSAQWPDHRDPRATRTPDGKVDLNGPTPRMPDGKPDLSGRPWAKELLQKRMADNSKDNPDVWCLPLGNQQFNVHTFPRKVVQSRDLVLILYETHQGIRQIFTDGRSIPKDDPQPWFYGYSVGRWEGDTLVVETSGFRDGGWLDINGSPLTEQGRTIERIRRPNFGTIEIEQTIDDPKAYTRPFTTRLTWRLMPDTEIMEMICLENNQSIHHLVGADGPVKKP